MRIFDIFRPNWKSSDEDVRLKSLGKIHNVNTLFWILQNDKSPKIKMGVINILTDLKSRDFIFEKSMNLKDEIAIEIDKVLREVLISERNEQVRLKILNSKTIWLPSELVEEIAIQKENPEIQKAAIQKITNQNLLYDIALNQEFLLEVRIQALKGLTKRDYLNEISNKSTEEEIRKKAGFVLSKLRKEEINLSINEINQSWDSEFLNIKYGKDKNRNIRKALRERLLFLEKTFTSQQKQIKGENKKERPPEIKIYDLRGSENEPIYGITSIDGEKKQILHHDKMTAPPKEKLNEVLFLHQLIPKKFDSGDFEITIFLCNKLIEISPMDANSYIFRGLSKFKLGNLNEALKDVKFACAIEPDNSEFREALKMLENTAHQ